MRSTKPAPPSSAPPRRVLARVRTRDGQARAGSTEAARQERPALSPRQREVESLLVGTGLSYKEIAARLEVSEGTIRTHVEEVYQKHGVHSRFELIAAVRAAEAVNP